MTLTPSHVGLPAAFAVALTVNGCKSRAPSEGELESRGRSVAAGSDVANGGPSMLQTGARPDATEVHQGSTEGHAIQTVFIILMENRNWREVEGSDSAPYINHVVLPMASYAKRYFNPPSMHPSEPNYLWLVTGTNFGIRNDGSPMQNHQATTQHLANQLENAGISWKAYQEDIIGDTCPLTGTSLYAPKHNPFVFFDDVTNQNDPRSRRCILHVRPYRELEHDLASNAVARFNFITPNLCNDMHDYAGCRTPDNVKNGDTWLSAELPKLLASRPYKEGGAIFITWDEGDGNDGPIGMIVLSPRAKGHGYTNEIAYTHSSTLRTFQEIFSVAPLLGDAANATDLGDLFERFP